MCMIIEHIMRWDITACSSLCIVLIWHVCLFLFFGSFLNSCGCSTAKSKTPPQETSFFTHLPVQSLGPNHPWPLVIENCMVSVLEVRIEPGDLNPRPLTPQSVTLPTLPPTLQLYNNVLHWCYNVYHCYDMSKHIILLWHVIAYCIAMTYHNALHCYDMS